MNRQLRTALLLGLAASAEPLLAQDKSACPVTRPPAQTFTPPAPFPQRPSEGFFYIGSPDLWTAVLVRAWPAVTTDEGFRVKVPWFVADLSSEELANPRIRISAHRLDGPTAAIKVEGPGNARLKDYSFFASVLVFPSAGCWEITATRANTELKFTILIGN